MSRTGLTRCACGVIRLEMIDLNGDGVIDFQEFCDVFPNVELFKIAVQDKVPIPTQHRKEPDGSDNAKGETAAIGSERQSPSQSEPTRQNSRGFVLQPEPGPQSGLATAASPQLESELPPVAALDRLANAKLLHGRVATAVSPQLRQPRPKILSSLNSTSSGISAGRDSASAGMETRTVNPLKNSVPDRRTEARANGARSLPPLAQATASASAGKHLEQLRQQYGPNTPS